MLAVGVGAIGVVTEVAGEAGVADFKVVTSFCSELIWLNKSWSCFCSSSTLVEEVVCPELVEGDNTRTKLINKGMIIDFLILFLIKV